MLGNIVGASWRPISQLFDGRVPCVRFLQGSRIVVYWPLHVAPSFQVRGINAITAASELAMYRDSSSHGTSGCRVGKFASCTLSSLKSLAHSSDNVIFFDADFSN